MNMYACNISLIKVNIDAPSPVWQSCCTILEKEEADTSHEESKCNQFNFLNGPAIESVTINVTTKPIKLNQIKTKQNKREKKLQKREEKKR